MNDITKIKVDGELESTYKLFSKNREFEKRAGGNTGSQSGVQPDWNQNDETQPDYVKNRPFYTGDPVETVLVEESTVSFSFSNDEGMYTGLLPSTFDATVGNTYKVYWDGSTYECTCVDFFGNSAIGNLSIVGRGADTGEPFFMVLIEAETYIYTADTSASHTFSVSGMAPQVVKIADKYISDTFRDVIIAGDPIHWSATDWTKYYNLYQSGKLLKINSQRGSTIEGYVLSMTYVRTPRIHHIAVVDSAGGFYKLSAINMTGELYWSPIFELDNLYFRYVKTENYEEYEKLEAVGGLRLVTKEKDKNPVKRNVVLEGDKELILSSSTPNSTKKFKITVDDSGAFTATEVT